MRPLAAPLLALASGGCSLLGFFEAAPTECEGAGCADGDADSDTDADSDSDADCLPEDLDCDGWLEPEDCWEGIAAYHPGASDPPGDGQDSNCDGVDGVDADGDGWRVGGDCDDEDPEVHPGAIDEPRWTVVPIDATVGATATNASIAFDPEDGAHVSYLSRTSDSRSVMYANRPAVGQWAAPVEIDDSVGTETETSLSVRGSPAVAYTDAGGALQIALDEGDWAAASVAPGTARLPSASARTTCSSPATGRRRSASTSGRTRRTVATAILRVDQVAPVPTGTAYARSETAPPVSRPSRGGHSWRGSLPSA
ncbi:MAG: hypothetical protein HYY06_01870 [Deltaproteobacteria bacterium]|nr:hypothetical protein [Deltaproteobacteria bacterium]